MWKMRASIDSYQGYERNASHKNSGILFCSWTMNANKSHKKLDSDGLS